MAVMLTDAEIAAAALADESIYRLDSFTPEDALAIGMSIRKRFLSSFAPPTSAPATGGSRHRRMASNPVSSSTVLSAQPSLLISIKTIQGVPLFACSVGGGQTVLGMDGWKTVDALVRVVKRTGHSTLYIEKGLKAMGQTLESLGLTSPVGIPKDIVGGGFPVWVRTVPSAPVGIITVYSAASVDDHQLITSTLRHWISKHQQARSGNTPPDVRSDPS